MGTYLARRRDVFHRVALLYQLPDGFYAELAYDVQENEVEHLFAFEAGSQDDRLPDYAAFVKLLGWMPEME